MVFILDAGSWDIFEIPLSWWLILFLHERMEVLNLVWCYAKRRFTAGRSKNEEKTKRWDFKMSRSENWVKGAAWWKTVQTLVNYMKEMESKKEFLSKEKCKRKRNLCQCIWSCHKICLSCFGLKGALLFEKRFFISDICVLPVFLRTFEKSWSLIYTFRGSNGSFTTFLLFVCTCCLISIECMMLLTEHCRSHKFSLPLGWD